MKRRKIESKQIVGLSNEFCIVRDLYEFADGSRVSVQLSSWIPLTDGNGVKINRRESASDLLKKYPIQKNVVY